MYTSIGLNMKLAYTAYNSIKYRLNSVSILTWLLYSRLFVAAQQPKSCKLSTGVG